MNETLQLNAALSIFSDCLNEIKVACIENMSSAIESIKKPESNWVSEEMYKARVGAETKTRMLVVKRIVARQEHVRSPRVSGLTDLMVERAKEYPIKELFTELTNTPVRAGMAKCPFHDDSTASLSLRRYNRYRCFGCEEKGSTIDLYMKLNKCNFIQAVKSLQ